MELVLRTVPVEVKSHQQKQQLTTWGEIMQRKKYMLVGALVLAFVIALSGSVAAVQSASDDAGAKAPADGTVSEMPGSVAAADLELETIVALLKADGIPVAGWTVESLEVDGGAIEVYAVDVPSRSSDEDVLARVRSFRVMAMARAEGEISAAYANVQIIRPDGFVDSLRIEIPEIDMKKVTAVSADQLVSRKAALLPKIEQLAAGQSIAVKDCSVTTEDGVPVVSVDVVLGEKGEQRLAAFSDQLWGLARAPETAMGAGYLRVFDVNGKQVVSEAQDFALSMRMIESDIAYPE